MTVPPGSALTHSAPGASNGVDGPALVGLRVGVALIAIAGVLCSSVTATTEIYTKQYEPRTRSDGTNSSAAASLNLFNAATTTITMTDR